jgi:hypothetical protein
MSQPDARLWADTGGAEGFSTAKHQFVYDGQQVVFELEAAPSRTLYAVFDLSNKVTIVNMPTEAGRYRWSHAFSGGEKPTVYEVIVTGFDVRDKCDWVYNKQKDTWELYPGINDKPDVQATPERIIKITCYRAQVQQKFTSRGGPPKQVSLVLVKPNGENVPIPQRRGTAPDAPGFLLLGPDKDGACEVSYSPTYKEVSRGSTTRAEVLIEHADGSTERLVQQLKTP